MEKLISTTEKLLIANDHAVIPGLGGFFVQQHSAEYCDGRILPPGAGISFNAIVQHNDGYMAIELMRSENISYKEANNLIKKDTEEFIKRLGVEKVLTFGKCGIFSLNDAQQLIFTPALNPAFLPANMGIKSIRTSVPESKKKITLVPVYQAIWKYAAIIAIILTFFVNNKLEKPDSSSMAGILPSNIISVDEMRTKEAKIKQNVPIVTEIKSTNSVNNNKTLVNTQISVSNTTEYQVVVAVLDSEKSAQNYCESIKSDAFPDASISKAKAGHRVILKSFENKSEAEKFASSIRNSNPEFSDAWVGKK